MSKREDYFTVEDLKYSDDDIRHVVSDIDEHGFAEIGNAIQPWVLAEARDYLDRHRAKLGTHSFSLRWSDMDPCVLTRLQQSRSFKLFMSRILNQADVVAPENGYIYHVVRCTNGLANSRDAYKYHFDQYNLTVLVPIVTPSDGDLSCGDLVLFPNIRHFNGSLIRNLLFKVLFQNRITRSVLSKEWAQHVLNAVVVKVKPGNMYAFYGFRTYHGNKQIDPSLSRMTGLFHYHDTFEDNEIIKGLEAYRPRPQDRTGMFAGIRVSVAYLGIFYRTLIKGHRKQR